MVILATKPIPADGPFISFVHYILYFVLYARIDTSLFGLLCPWWGPIWLRLVATKETHFPICVVDSQIVLTTQLMQSWASPSVLLASPSNTATTITTHPGTQQPKRREESTLTATTAAAAAAASFPPSHLRVGDRGGRSEQKGSQEEVPLQPVSSHPTSSYPILARGLILLFAFWLPH